MFPFSLTSERSSLKILIMGCCCIEDYNQWDTLAEGYTLPQLCSFYLTGLKSTIIKKCAGNLWVGILNIKGKWLIELHKGDQGKPKFCSRWTQVFVQTAKAICRQHEWIIFLPNILLRPERESQPLQTFVSRTHYSLLQSTRILTALVCSL